MREKKIWKIVLTVLVVVILGLIIAIVTVNLNGGNGEEEGVVEMSEEEKDRAALGAIRNYIYPLSVEDSLNYVDGKISEYEGTDLEFGVRLIKIYVLMNSGFTEEALTAAEEIETRRLDDESLMQYYEAMWQLYEQFGDEETAYYYYDLYNAKYLEMNGGGYGG